MRSALEGNITKLYFLKISRWFLLIMPIIVPFFNSKGLDVQDIMLLQSIFAIMVVAFEIPSGYFGDVLGRKNSLIIGAFFSTLGFSMYVFTEGFWGLVVVETLLGIGGSFISGSDSALLYDSLKALERENEYVKLEGRMSATGNFSEAAAGILGGFLATISLNLPFIVQAIVCSMVFFVTISLYEPPRVRMGSEQENWTNILKVIKEAMVNNVLLRYVLLFGGLMGSGTLMMAWFAQPYFQHSEVPLVWFGVLWTILNLVVGVGSWFAYKIQDRLEPTVILSLVAILLGGSYIGAAIAPLFVIGFLFLLLSYITRGIISPIIKDYINTLADSSVRATILSMYSFLFRLFFAIFAPFLGYITKTYSIEEAFYLWGFFLIIGGVGIVWKLGGIKEPRNRRTEEPKSG